MTGTNGETWRKVTAENRCPICKRDGWCAVLSDGSLCRCQRVATGGEERTDSEGTTWYLHRLIASTNGTTSTPPRFSLADGGGERADADTLHKVYSALLDALPLDAHHVDRLRQRGLKGDLRAAGYRSMGQGRDRAKAVRAVRAVIAAGLEELLPRVPGFYVKEGDRGAYWTVGGAAGLVIPIRDVQGRIIALQVRADFVEGKAPRYSFISSKKRGGAGPGSPVHVPVFDGDKSTLRITEGGLKATIATELSGILTAGLVGLNWQKAAAVVRDLGAKTVRVAFDADARRKPEVSGAQLRLVRDLRARGLAVELEVWLEDDGKGIDDLLANGKTPQVLTGDDALAGAEVIDREARGVPVEEPKSDAVPTVFRNYFVEEIASASGKPMTVKVGLSSERIKKDLDRIAGNWPKRVGKLLFAEGGGEPLWLDGAHDLLAWTGRQLQSRDSNPVQWTDGEDKVSRGEFFAYLQQTAEAYDAVEKFPHCPPLPRHYYMHPELAGETGRHWPAFCADSPQQPTPITTSWKRPPSPCRPASVPDSVPPSS
jgi:Domain of unknown function (DUF3854)